MVNWQNVERVLDAIDHERERFDMGSYYYGDDTACGSTMCIAGWAAHLAGWTLSTGSPMAKRIVDQGSESGAVASIAMGFMGLDGIPLSKVYNRLFDPEAFDSTVPSTDDIRARIKTFE